MKLHALKLFAPGLFAASALVLAPGASAQTPPPTPAPAAAKSPEATSMTGHHKGSHARAKHRTDLKADLKAECEGMMAKSKEMQEKLKAMDATLDTLLAEMNAAKSSKEVDALEKPMAAVINELVAQRKASRAMMMEMQPEMMGHMAHHMGMRGAKGAMGCPMMKMGNAPEAKAGDKKPTM